jgi:hypothetical protein
MMKSKRRPLIKQPPQIPNKLLKKKNNLNKLKRHKHFLNLNFKLLESNNLFHKATEL